MPRPGAGGDEHHVAVGLDQLEAERLRFALEFCHGVLGQRPADREFVRVVAEIGGRVADDLGVAGDKLAVLGQRQRIDLQQFQVLLACDVRQPRGVARQARGKIGRKQLAERGKDFFRRRRRIGHDRDARELGGRFDILAAFGRDQQFEPLRAAVDAHRDKNFAGDRHRFLEQQRDIGIFERRQDQPAGVAKTVKLVEHPHQAALAAAAFEELRLEHEAGPIGDRRRAGFRRHEPARRAARRCRGGAARLFRRTRLVA